MNKISKLTCLSNKDIDSSFSIFKGFWDVKDIHPYSLGVPKNINNMFEPSSYDKSRLNDFKEGQFSFFECWFNDNPNLSNLNRLNLINKDISELSLKNRDIILIHNSKIKLANKTLDQKYVEKFIDWRAYNTPTSTSLKVTPLDGTDFGFGINNYEKWKISTFMLITEYNFIIKALTYMTSIKSANLSDECKNSYTYWKVRQNLLSEINTGLFSLLDEGIINFSNSHISLYSLDTESLLREVIEDFLYVALNILLAKSVLENTELNKHLDNEDLYFKILDDIFKKHFIDYKGEYDYLYSIRKHLAYNFVSLDDIKNIYKLYL